MAKVRTVASPIGYNAALRLGKGGTVLRGLDVRSTDWRRYQAGDWSLEKINNYVTRKGYSFTPGEGRSLVEIRNLDSRSNGQIGWGTQAPNADWSIALYGPAQKKVKPTPKKEQPPASKPGGTPDKGASTKPFPGTPAANAAIASGQFDVPARPRWGQQFVAEFLDGRNSAGAAGGSGFDEAAARRRLFPDSDYDFSKEPLADGYPRRAAKMTRSSDDDDERRPSWSLGGSGLSGAGAGDRPFAASQRFRDQLMGVVTG